MKTLPVNQASNQLDDLVDAAIAGEEMVLMRDNELVAKLVAVASANVGIPQFGSARGLNQMSDDFDEPFEFSPVRGDR